MLANAGDWAAFIQLSFSNNELSSFITNTILGNISTSNLQKINPHEICTRIHAAVARMQLQWMSGLISDIGLMRIPQLLLLLANAILDICQHMPPFVAAWRRVATSAEAILQHSAHVLLMETGYQEAVAAAKATSSSSSSAAAAVSACAANFHPHIPRGVSHFAYRSSRLLLFLALSA
jgi:hypothetical protein